METKPEYYWPIWKKLLRSAYLIAVGLGMTTVICFIKFGALFIKSWQGADVPWVMIGLMNVFFKWDAMWKEDPPSYY